jgi:OTT_1508-like deaminase
VRECYRVRKDSLLDLLKPFTGQGQTRHHEFEQLYKLLCKLGKHVTVSRKLIESAVLLPQDFNQRFMIKTVPSSKPQKLPLRGKEATIESTAGRMFPDSAGKDKFLARLQSVWNTDELSTVLQQELATKTRVHAELLLVNHFDKQGCTFLDGSDKYIGCSKPACYLCYAYISSHPRQYALPPSHQKIYVAWRLPDIYSHEVHIHERVSTREKVLLNMIALVRRDLITEIESREPQRPFHADSTAGITSNADSHAFETATLLESLSLNDANVNGKRLSVRRERSAE